MTDQQYNKVTCRYIKEAPIGCMMLNAMRNAHKRGFLCHGGSCYSPETPLSSSYESLRMCTKTKGILQNGFTSRSNSIFFFGCKF